MKALKKCVSAVKKNAEAALEKIRSISAKNILSTLKGNRKKLILTVLCLIFTVIFIVTLVSLISRLSVPKEIKKIQEVASFPQSADGLEDKITIPVNFAELKTANPDIYAWIKVSGTDIDYPILRSNTEDFYLTHDVEGKKSAYGAIYTQSCNTDDFTDFNTAIYGHNMINGTMFGSLKKYRNKDFFEQNRYISIYTPEKILKYRIFAAYVTDDSHQILNHDFTVAQQCADYINAVFSGRYGGNLATDSNVTENDRIITLSTCTDRDSERYLVQAVLISEQIAE